MIGAGSAGFSAAIAAAEQGASVLLVGHGMIGGTCVNTGCIPSKNLIRVAEAIHSPKNASRFAGVTGQAELTDWRAVLRQKQELVEAMRKAKYHDLLPGFETITYVEGKARLENTGVSVDGFFVSASRVAIATGASPSLPPIPGLENVPYLTSTTALALDALPASLVVIGGGFIGCELGQMFARLGVRVAIADLVPILASAEPEVSRALGEYFREEGIAVLENARIHSVENTATGVALAITARGEEAIVEAGRILVATGRNPNTAGLGLAEAGVELDSDGGIKVDRYMRTTKPGVYAAGDVTGRDQFVYMAAYGAKIAALNALRDDDLVYDNSTMPAVAFTDPQVASVGMTEAAARAAGYDVRTSTIGLDQVPRALATRDTRGMIKLVADSRTGKLLGAHILAPEGADSVQTAALAIRQGMTVHELAGTIFPYLTTVEGLRLAAQGFEKDVARLSCCAG